MQNRSAIYVVLAVLTLAGLYAVLRPQPGREATQSVPTVAGTASSRMPASPPARSFELVVRAGKLVSGPALIVVTQGDAVVLRIQSDRSDELHLHGYDLHAHLRPGEPATLAFVADKSGRFEYELHRAHADLGALEVHPRE